MNIKVSVFCCAYNQERFIRKTLDGFVMQKTDFPFEVLVHDDASTDNTPNIIKEYAEKYPDIIIPILSSQNHFRAGINTTNVEFLPRMRGEYVAHCDGDDYWIDENKLQKQVDFLDSHPEYIICATRAKIVWSDGLHSTEFAPSKRFLRGHKYLTFDDLLKENFIINSSVMYRWLYKPTDYPSGIMPGDWFIHLLHAQYGKIKILPEPMVVYSRWSGGIWQSGAGNGFYTKNAHGLLQFYYAVEQKFNVDKSLQKGELISKILTACVATGQIDTVCSLFKEFPDLYKCLSMFTTELMDNNTTLKRKIKHIKQSLYYILPILAILLVIVRII